jgi:molybdate transport system permease protein
LKPVIEALVAMPLVLPPTVLGFYLLMFFSPDGGVAKWMEETIGLQLVFTFEGLVIASLIYSLPFAVQPLQSGFSTIQKTLLDASFVLGKSRFETLLKVQLPNMKPAILTALVLTFAHTIGEFGVVLMIGGNIPGETKVASIAVYDQVESLNFYAANIYSIILFVVSFLILLLVFMFNRGYLTRQAG